VVGEEAEEVEVEKEERGIALAPMVKPLLPQEDP